MVLVTSTVLERGMSDTGERQDVMTVCELDILVRKVVLQWQKFCRCSRVANGSNMGVDLQHGGVNRRLSCLLLPPVLTKFWLSDVNPHMKDFRSCRFSAGSTSWDNAQAKLVVNHQLIKVTRRGSQSVQFDHRI